MSKISAPCTWLVALALMAALPAAGQAYRVGFMPPVETALTGEAAVVTADGRELTGKLGSFFYGNTALGRFTLKTTDGGKVKLRPAEVERLTVRLGKLAKLEMAAEATSTLEKAWKADFEQIFRFDRAVFDRVAWPDAQDAVLLQLINPGFDSRHRVYYLRSAKSGTWSVGDIDVAGDESKAFVVVREGQEPYRVRKKSYFETDFLHLFGDCPEMLAAYGGAHREFRRIAEHVFAYEQLCGDPAI